MKVIECANCGEPCGKEYPDRISDIDGGEPGFREGKGEDFALDGVWFCSQKCLNFAMAEIAFANREDFDPRMRP